MSLADSPGPSRKTNRYCATEWVEMKRSLTNKTGILKAQVDPLSYLLREVRIFIAAVCRYFAQQQLY